MSLKRSILTLSLPFAALATAVVLTGPMATAQTAAKVPSPTVTGPIAAKAPGDASKDYPWMATMHNLAAVGYVEEEYFYEGTAREFNTTGANAQNAALVSSGHKYKTRMIIRRPKDAKKFNGTVLAEWENVTAGYDLDAMWGGTFEHIVRGGYAWVGISPQRVGVQAPPNGLKVWSPTRYASLDVTDGGKLPTDQLSYDIYAQGIEALKHPTGTSPMGGLAVKHVIAMGASQSAGRLGTYINALHGTLGSSIDGYILSIGGARVREDIAVPVFKILSETDIPGQIGSRQPNTAKIHRWEIVGTSHSSRRTGLNSGPLTKRDRAEPRAPTNCTYPTYPRTPINYASGSAYDYMVRWVEKGTPPPEAPLAEIETRPAPPPAPARAGGAPAGGRGGATPPAAAAGRGGAVASATPGRGGAAAGRGGAAAPTTVTVIKRDEKGNALGGIRLAEFSVHTSLSTGANSGTQFCNLYGRYEPFSDAEINTLYPTHKAYVDAVKAQTDANLKAGYIQAPEARRTNARAQMSYIGSGDPCKSACRLAIDLQDNAYYYLGLTNRADAMGSQMAAIVRQIAKSDGAKGKPTDKAAANRALDGWMSAVQSLQTKGTITALAANELITGAYGVKTALNGGTVAPAAPTLGG